jgi:CBS domain-containing protein
MPSTSAAQLPQELEAAAAEITEDKARIVSPRMLISWFGAQRRGYWVVKRIREALVSLDLTTNPDFEYAWIDEEVELKKASTVAAATGISSGTATAVAVSNTSAAVPSAPPGGAAVASDPTYRIGKLDAANRAPVSVTPDDAVEKAITVMMTNDYSQLPVMQGERALKGLISWETIAQTVHFGKPCVKVSDCMAAAFEISSDASLFDAIEGIIKRGYALIRSRDNKVSGIVTSTDLGVQLGRLGEPFLLLGELENYLRRVIEGRFTLAQIQSAKDPADTRIVNSVEDLTFGEYIRLLENPTNWSTLRLSLERTEFVRGLQEIREIRNDVMHFDPDGPSDKELGTLRRWVGLFQRLATLGVLS